MISKDRRNIFLVLGISLVISFILFNYSWSHLNSFFFYEGGDALKNYYTYLYYAKWGGGIQFNGMNYPRGEHIMFTDAIIPVSLLVNSINNLFSTEVIPALAFLNLLLLLSPVVGSAGLFLLFRKYKVQSTFCIVFSILIAFFSPQNSRLWGHYSLTFMFIPFVLYWTLCYFESNKRRYIIYLLLTCFIMLFTHLYHFMMIYMFLFVYVFLGAFIIKKLNLVKSISLLLSITSLLIGFLFWMNITDGISDRPDKPWGFFFARADYYTVFLPMYNKYLLNLLHVDLSQISSFEGRAYIGISSTILLLVSFTLFRHRRFIPDLNLLFLSSVVILLFSTGLPFTLHWEQGLDIIPFLRQFRAPGRFVWIFYYVVFVWILIHFQKSRIIKNPLLKNAIFIVYLTILSIDIFEQVRSYSSLGKNEIGKDFINSSYQTYFKNNNICVDSFQAIIPFPYFHIGSELIQIDATQIFYEAAKCSYETGLSMTNSFLSRASYSESVESAQLISSPYSEKKYLSKCKQDKPFLIISSAKNLPAYELYYLHLAKCIDTVNGAILARIYPSQLQPKTKEIDSIKTLKLKPVYSFSDTLLCKANCNSITTGYLPLPLHDTSKYTLTIGVEHLPSNGALPYLLISHSLNDKVIKSDSKLFSQSHDIGNNEVYFSVEIQKGVKEEKVSVSLNRFYGKILSIQIRRSSDAVFSQMSGNEYINGIPLNYRQ